jgi:hypothetical protein
MRVVWVVSVGLSVWAASCAARLNENSDGDGSGGSSGGSSGRAGESGVGGAPAGSGGTGTGGSEAGAAGIGTAGASPCECEGDPNVPDPEVHCTLPLELFCLDDDPLGCATTLSEALSGLDAQCFPSERYGTLSECADDTTELIWNEPLEESTHRLVFDENGRLIGRHHFGSAYSGLHSNVCLETGYFDFFEYEAGVLPTRTCETTCDICPTDGAGGASLVCGQGGQGGR